MNRDLKPTPEAVFAMFHWHDSYAHKGLGSMGFFDQLPIESQRYCADAVGAILKAGQSARAKYDGAAGGHARAAKLSPERRTEIARAAGVARWRKRR